MPNNIEEELRVAQGLLLRDALNAKIKHEAKAVFEAAMVDDLTNFHSEVNIKYEIRNELMELSMSHEMVDALYTAENPLHDAYLFYCTAERVNQVQLAMFEFLEKVEHEYVANKLYYTVKAEYDNYLKTVKVMLPEEIIALSYKLTLLHDIQASLDPKASTLTTEQIKALYSLEEPLWCIYADWQRRNVTNLDNIKDSIICVADKQADEIEKNTMDIRVSLHNQYEAEQTEEGYDR
ncbi:MAG: DUF3848 domain-containing protein [Defluviitaleaceae bacterium]|nr:DUF3848 domain-containing protein [Defluviitaleaceae bacterium]MCL2275169.1 DUF3848 domain-containing protein [Defluviitaleaceae bacterium]